MARERDSAETASPTTSASPMARRSRSPARRGHGGDVRRLLGYGLPRELWLVQLGILLNYLGWAAVMPFEVVYLHAARGFDLAFAGMIVGIATGLAVVVAPVSGTLIDRFGARWTATAGLGALGVGYAGLGLSSTELGVLLAATAAGLGNGLLQPSQSTLVASLVGQTLRPRASAVSRVASNLGVGIGGLLGGIVATRGLQGFIALYLVNAATYLIYAGIVVFGVHESARPPAPAGGYRLVLADHAFLRLAAINVGIIGIGWGVFTWLVPVFVTGTVGLGPQVVGLMVLANALTVVIGQVPVTRWAEGRRRVTTMAVAALLFAPACVLVVLGVGVDPTTATIFLIVAGAIVGLGECLHTSVLVPLVADLAPPAIRGRYMAATSMSWWLGLALAPTLGAQLMNVSAAGAFLVAIAITLATAASALALEPSLPPAVRLAPAPSPGGRSR